MTALAQQGDSISQVSNGTFECDNRVPRSKVANGAHHCRDLFAHCAQVGGTDPLVGLLASKMV